MNKINELDTSKPQREEANCDHHWTWYTYVINGQVTSKKLCFYCKKLEDTR